jgi:hypothetical protein
MALVDPTNVQLLLVSLPNDGDTRRSVVATGRNDALKTALRSAPIGSMAQLIEERLPLERLAAMNLRLGDARDAGVAHPDRTLSASAMA